MPPEKTLETPTKRGASAEELAKKQKEISVAEFFERNKHILGFGSSTRALLTAVKEGVDNSLDACEEARILPTIFVEIQHEKGDRYRIIAEDNGPGIVKEVVPNVFGRLLYGSRFHDIRQSRGQQGIGISAAVMYGQLTTGHPALVHSKIASEEYAHYLEIEINTARNKPKVVKKDLVKFSDPEGRGKESGVRVEIRMEGKYPQARRYFMEYFRSTAIVNPHLRLRFTEPDGNVLVYERVTDKLPPLAHSIKPHPYGIEMGTLLKMAGTTTAKTMATFLREDFSQVSRRIAKLICLNAGVEEKKRPGLLKRNQAQRMIKAIMEVRIQPPSSECLSPIGETLIKKGLRKELKAEFIVTSVREPRSHSGSPFLVEAGIVYGSYDASPSVGRSAVGTGTVAGSGEQEILSEEEKKKRMEKSASTPVTILRFANRVPLLYQQKSGVISRAIESINWRNYGLEQRGGRGIPTGPVTMLVHVASTNVPFTSEAKEAIADIEIIRSEAELALRQCGRKLNVHIKRKKKRGVHREKLKIIEKLLPEINSKTCQVLGLPKPTIAPVIGEIMNSYMFMGDVRYNASRRMHTISTSIANYTRTSKKFRLFIEIPHKALITDVNPGHKMVKWNSVIWEVPAIPPGEKRKFSFNILGFDEDEIDEVEVFQKGLNESYVFGAELWMEPEDEEN